MTLAAQVSHKILILNQKTIISELGIFFTVSLMPLHLCLVLYLFTPEHPIGVAKSAQRGGTAASEQQP